MNERCRFCDVLLEKSFTTFTVAKKNAVYVVKDAPCLECPKCGEIMFNQDITERLSLYTSGRVWSKHRPLSAWVFEWGDPAVEVKPSPVIETFNKPVASARTASLSLAGK